MRSVAVGAMVVALCLLGAAGADARELGARVSVSGEITVSWHGDEARGCARAGLCGYRGGFTLRPGPEGQFQIESPARGGFLGYAYFDSTQPVTVRVLRGDASSGGACADVLDAEQFDVNLRSAGHGRARTALSTFGASSGRCAGPALSDALSRIASRPVSIARLRSGGATFDLARRLRFSAGRFSGTIRSTVKMRVGKPREEDLPEFPHEPLGHGGGRPGPRVAIVRAAYRIDELSGSFRATFAGPPGSECGVFDACGVTGAEGWAVLARGGFVEIEAFAPARRSDRGVRGAIRALNRGQTQVSTLGYLPHAKGSTTAVVYRHGEPACNDGVPQRGPTIASTLGPRTIVFELGGSDAEQPVDDVIRTGCQGPTQFDVLGQRAMATGRVPFSTLVRRRLEVPLRAAGRFSGNGYSGTRRARFTLDLTRRSLKVSYRRLRG